MPEEIGACDAEFLLCEIPRQLRERRREHQRRDAALRVVGLQPAALDAMRDEVVGVTPPPRGLRPRAASDLTGRRRTRSLAMANTAVRHKPAPADAAGTLREHPQMLASSVGTQGGPFLASDPGSILASAEDWDWSGAQKEFTRAIELNPRNGTAHQRYAAYFVSMARMDDAIAENKRAQEMEPQSLMINSILGRTFYQARQYDQAITELRKSLEMDVELRAEPSVPRVGVRAAGEV
jgi:hypothetical protein